ncbi:MAG: UDP-N-acetylglucosamine--N-acetylmuramyl-(pentapeptide) pyrophosphoryl-undecaprenol N-acetylglucosamine transferase [Candidatus Harrisonbacteria bacterium]|nr:UDP-N-acetylglucosamine--N-acetylmuramyl-(pentapeptide) pyrophosphoryl-undecaprenol N-acetylglucosamine transferase [Candidatus Harrisonbacteria bacterium]
MKKPRRILLCGGGSGGHIFPLVAKVEAMDGQAEFYYAGPDDRYRNYLEQIGVICFTVYGAKLRRYFSLKNILDFFLFFFSFLQAIYVIFRVWPDEIYSKGGPGALPVVVIGWLFQVPVTIHESDTIPGLTNRISARFATRIEVSFSYAKKYFSNPKKVVVVEHPIRQQALSGLSLSQKEAKERLGFDPKKKLLVVVGGSMASTRINKVVFQALMTLGEKGWQILHQVGETDWLEAKRMKADFYKPMKFIEEMGVAYQAADVVLSRAGSSLFEIAAYKKPMILVPLPEAANDHQSRNAAEAKKMFPGVTVFTEEEYIVDKLLAVLL